MANVSFHRKTSSVNTTGALTFNTSSKGIYLYDGSTAHYFNCSTSAGHITSGTISASRLGQASGTYYSLWGQGKISSETIVESSFEYDYGGSIYSSEAEGYKTNCFTALQMMPDNYTSSEWYYIYSSTCPYTYGTYAMRSITIRLDLYSIFYSYYTTLSKPFDSIHLPKDFIMTCKYNPSTQSFEGEATILPARGMSGTHTVDVLCIRVELFCRGSNAVFIQGTILGDSSTSRSVNGSSVTDYYCTQKTGFGFYSGITCPDDGYQAFEGMGRSYYPNIEKCIYVLGASVTY